MFVAHNAVRKVVVLAVVGTVLLACSLPEASAKMVHFRNEVSAESSLIHHYTFEGVNATERQADKKGTNNLVTHTAGSGSAASIAYLPGFDGNSLAMQPHYIDVDNGAGLQTSSGVALPNSGFTVELLISAGATPGTDVGYAVSGPLFPTRAYPLLQREGDFKVAAGGANFSDGNALRDVTSGYNVNDWYYVAVTMQNSGANTLVNSYIASLTAGDTSLTQTLSNVVISGNYSTAANTLGIGKFANSTQPLNGLLDEVAIYDSVLGLATLNSHFDALISTPPVPEPSSLLLLSLGSLVLVRSARRRTLKTAMQ